MMYETQKNITFRQNIDENDDSDGEHLDDKNAIFVIFVIS